MHSSMNKIQKNIFIKIFVLLLVSLWNIQVTNADASTTDTVLLNVVPFDMANGVAGIGSTTQCPITKSPILPTDTFSCTNTNTKTVMNKGYTISASINIGNSVLFSQNTPWKINKVQIGATEYVCNQQKNQCQLTVQNPPADQQITAILMPENPIIPIIILPPPPLPTNNTNNTVPNPTTNNTNTTNNNTTNNTNSTPIIIPPPPSPIPPSNNATNSSNTNNTNSTQNTNPQLPQFQVTFNPANTVALNFSSFALNAATNIVTTCKWGFADVTQANMTNNFSTTNGLNHAATINSLRLGNNNIFVACNNQDATTNNDLVYFVKNILDGSTVSGTNNLNSSIILNSTVQSSSVSNSNIVNTTINGSSIINSTIINVIVNNAIITNNNMTSGTITINNVSYNATAQSPIILSQLIPKAPVASFTKSASIVEPGNIVQFTSTSTDVDINGPLQDSLKFFWDFGDSTTSELQNLNKIYSREGTFTITLRVTDKFNLSSTQSATITVRTFSSTQSSSSSSSSSSTASSRTHSSQTTTAQIIRNVHQSSSANTENPPTIIHRIVQTPVVKTKEVTTSEDDQTTILALVFVNTILVGLVGYTSFVLVKNHL